MSDSEIRRPCAAVALVEREDGKVLVVWNKRYGRWSMPGGKVEDGESPADAVRREIKEEVGAVAVSVDALYDGSPGARVDAGRGQYVYVFACAIAGPPREREPGCPVTWFTREEFLLSGVIPDFYAKVFAAAKPKLQPMELIECQCHGCGQTAVGSTLYGWTTFPVGWFVADGDDGAAFACGRACVDRIEASSEG